MEEVVRHGVNTQGTLPETGQYDAPPGVTEALMEFNVQVWKSKRDKGVALKEPIQVEVPKKLEPYLPDLTRMHHIIG